MAKALDIAYELIRMASREDEPDFLTHMRLQKLLYYVQGWHLAMHEKPIFNDEIEAWAHGPVVRSVYDQFKHFDNKPIILDEATSPKSKIGRGESDFVASVWEAYKGYSAWSLRQMTHNESPWKNARGGLDAAAKSTNKILRSDMQSFFRSSSK